MVCRPAVSLSPTLQQLFVHVTTHTTTALYIHSDRHGSSETFVAYHDTLSLSVDTFATYMTSILLVTKVMITTSALQHPHQ